MRLLRGDVGRGALLLERSQPGEPATSLVPDHDEDAVAAAVGVLRRLHQPPPPGCRLPDLSGQGAAFSEYLQTHPGAGPPRSLVVRASALFDELFASSTRTVVLHGDLHHDNLLSAVREPWLAIDPHGVVGDRGYDVGSLLFNPHLDRRDDELLSLVPARVEQLADGMALPVDDVVAWGFVKAVLSEVWSAHGTATHRTATQGETAAQALPRGMAVQGSAHGRGSELTRAFDVAMMLLPRLA